jgi:hypothetical protein
MSDTPRWARGSFLPGDAKMLKDAAAASLPVD